MKFSAAYRSLLEALSILLLTRILADSTFASLISTFYPIYFVANLIFSSSTVDFAGGQKRTHLTNAFLMLALPAIFLIPLLVHNQPIHFFYYVVGGLTAIDSLAFVFCESTSKRTFLLIMIAPRALFAACIGVLLLRGAKLSLDDTIQLIFARDLILVLIGIAVLFLCRKNFLFRLDFRGVKIDEIIYLFISNSNEFVLRIVVNYFLGAPFVKEFEYALRIPRIAQAGLMLVLRHKIFAPAVAEGSPYPILRLQFAAALASSVILFLKIAGYLPAPSLILVCTLLATSAVPWYTEMLCARRFIFLIVITLLSFVVTVLTAVGFSDAYVSVVAMTLVLFLVSFVEKIKKVNIWQRI